MVVTVFQMNPTSKRVERTVVVGKATVLASKLAPQVIARAVPSSVMSILSISPCTGVPDRFVVMDVIACASPVICATSVTSVLIVGVADCVTAGARFVTRLFVSVSVPANVDRVPVVGSVTFVVPVCVNVSEKFPDVTRLFASVIVPVLLTPVPPRLAAKTPVHPSVNEVDVTTAPVGVPPSVSVTFVSSVLVILPSDPTPVPPLAAASVPVHPRVSEVACRSAVVGVPPNVNVTFVSFVFVSAAGVTTVPASHVGLADEP